MFKRVLEFTESVLATIIGGIFLLFDLIPHMIEQFTGEPLALMENIPFHFSSVTVVICGIPLIYSAVYKLMCNHGISKISSALLISIAMFAAVAIGDMFAAGEVAFIMAIGEILEHKTTQRARKGLKNLISLAPVQGRRLTSGREEMIAAENICVGDILRILPGETIPVDGEIVSGETSVDQSIMTGESLPVDKSIGDNVFCGTINRFGAIDIRASKVGEDSSLQKLIRMVKDAENKKAPMQRIADKWASILVPVALLLAILAGIIKQDIVVAVTILVVFCPCALVLATPTAIMAAIGQATKHGVIIKSGEALEKMGKVDTVAFDKTGTLTYGMLSVSDVISFACEWNEDTLLTTVASAESKSEHPLGKAIVADAKAKKLSLKEAEDFRMDAGKGVFAMISGCAFFCGSEKYLLENKIVISKQVQNQIASLRNEGKAVVLCASEKEVIGVIALSDTLRPEAGEMIQKLEALDTDVVLLTGDHRKTAEYFAASVGISRVYSELLPEEKVKNIEKMQREGKKVCMIGDGVNDAPALKDAEVGVAMGTMGSDIAVEAADIALVGDDISKIPYLKRLSNATARTIKFGIFLSLFINFGAIILSFFELLTPTTGALVHNAGSCLVVLIAALLYDRKFD